MSGYRGEGHRIQPGCTLQAHYGQVQAMCDALGFAAQSLQAEHIQLQASAAKAASEAMQANDGDSTREYLQLADRHGHKAEYWYGVFQGYRGLLRAIEGNTGELEPLEQGMLERINWQHNPPFFSIPGFEQTQGAHAAADRTASETTNGPEAV